jgi:hypothetical protein
MKKDTQPELEAFLKAHNAHRIKTPQQQPKPQLGMTKNDCVDNAADYHYLYPDWQFCAGWIYSHAGDTHTLLAHAWNRKRHKHRDVTPFRELPPTDYILSEEWSQRLWDSNCRFRAGDQSQLGFIHPNYTWQEGKWITLEVPDTFFEILRKLDDQLLSHKMPQEA